MKTQPSVWFLVAVLLWGSSLLATAQTLAQRTAATSLAAQEKEACIKNLKIIHEAIQAYRQERKDLPNWLSDLVPKYLADSKILLCPTTVRSGETRTMVCGDPQRVTSYIYEFSAAPVNGTPQLTMKQWKRKQMGLLGSVVPILRCHTHAEVINLAFDGTVSTSPTYWENKFTNLVNFNDLMPPRLLEMDPVVAPPPRVKAEDESGGLLGQLAPNFKLELLEGGALELARLKGKNIVILDFWATWCGPCRAALPVMAEFAAEYKNKGVLYYAVDLEEKADKVRAYLSSSGLKLSVPMDKDGAVGRLYKVSGIPTLVVVGKDGTVQVVQVGFSPDLKNELKQKLDALLAGKSLAAGTAQKN